MKTWQKIIQHPTFRLLDHTSDETFHGYKNSALTSFAVDDALTLSVSDQCSYPVIRLWTHDKTIVLGIPDSRLPYIDAGVKYLVDHEYDVIIRNSGGLAVALDRGVLNLSLVLPEVKNLSIHDGYEAMLSFIQHMFRDLTNDIKAYEIVGSYCPGDYDLSIDGIKFAGISQRRIKDGAAIQIYMDIEGNSYERANLVRNFYDLSIQSEETKFTYPRVDPSVLGSLSNLLKVDLSVVDVKERVAKTLERLNIDLVSKTFSEKELATLETRYQQMVKRNERITKWL